MKPRDYQIAAVDAIWNHLMNGGGDTLLVLPTGTGKSPIMAWIVKRLLLAYPTLRILVLASRKELIKGNHKALAKIMPQAPSGIYSAGLNRKDTGAQVTFAGIASVVNRARLFAKTDIVLVDEAHEVSDDKEASYQKLFHTIRATNPHLQVIGLTATDFRMGMGKLTEGKLFKSVSFDLSSGEAFVWMVDQGYLAPLIPKAMENTIDLDGVTIQKGEYVTSKLVEAMDSQDAVSRALVEAVDKAADRNKWLVFAASIEQTEEAADKLNSLGIRATAIHSKLANKERDARLEAFSAGEYQALVNKDILTTGYDEPGIDCIVMLRPTRSPGLWVQMLGRGTRPVYASGFDLDTAEGRHAAMAAGPKQNCLVLDFAGNTMTLGPINYPRIPKQKKGGGGEAPVRECPECASLVHISIPACPECGYVFPVKEKLSNAASVEELIARMKPKVERVISVFPVDKMIATRHQKAGRPDSVRVDYYSGIRRFTVFVCPEHLGAARHLAKRWWGMHRPDQAEIPATTAAMLQLFDTMRKPTHIKVWVNTKYPEVLDYDFRGRAFALPTDPSGTGGT